MKLQKNFIMFYVRSVLAAYVIPNQKGFDTRIDFLGISLPAKACASVDHRDTADSCIASSRVRSNIYTQQSWQGRLLSSHSNAILIMFCSPYTYTAQDLVFYWQAPNKPYDFTSKIYPNLSTFPQATTQSLVYDIGILFDKKKSS